MEPEGVASGGLKHVEGATRDKDRMTKTRQWDPNPNDHEDCRFTPMPDAIGRCHRRSPASPSELPAFPISSTGS